MNNSIVSLRAAIISATKVLALDSDLDNVDDLTISLECSGDSLVLSFNDPTLPGVPLQESLTDTLVTLGEDVVERLRDEAEEAHESFKETFQETLSEVQDAINSDDVEEWEDILNDIISSAQNAKKRMNTEELENYRKFEEAADTLQVKLDEFKDSVAVKPTV